MEARMANGTGKAVAECACGEPAVGRFDVEDDCGIGHTLAMCARCSDEQSGRPVCLPIDPWVCDRCGGVEVEIAQWRDANTDALCGEGADGPVDYCHCRSCESDCEIVLRSERERLNTLEVAS
jgi:hypothetical protein